MQKRRRNSKRMKLLLVAEHDRLAKTEREEGIPPVGSRVSLA